MGTAISIASRGRFSPAPGLVRSADGGVLIESLFNRAFDSCSAPDVARIERLASALPTTVAKLLRDELAAGNAVLSIESGHPAPPVGVLVILAAPVHTLRGVSPAELVARELVRRDWPGRPRPTGWTDTRGHCWLLEPLLEASAGGTQRDAVVSDRSSASTMPPNAGSCDVASTPDEAFRRQSISRFSGSEALRAWEASRRIDYAAWREGAGYDLDALARLTPVERAAVEVSLLHGLDRWRDVAALAALDSERARAALRRVLREGSPALRMAVLRHAPHLAMEAGDAVREVALVQALAQADLYAGLSQALVEVQDFHPPAVVDALWRGLSEREGGIAVHFAAMLAYLHGLAEQPFDWAQRAFFLRFHTEDAAERTDVIAELRQRIAQR